MPTYIFEPPTLAINPPFLPDSDAQQVGLWRHYRPAKVGINVFKLNNGSFVQQQSTPTITAMTNLAGHTTSGPQPPWTPTEALLTSNVPYPWNPYYPNAPYSTVYNWTGSVTTTTLTPRIVQVFYGGHENLITESTATELIAAGYGDCIRAA